METNDLDLVETGELMEALFRRSSVAVILLTKHRDDDTDLATFATKGNEEFCLGSCEAMAARLRIMIEHDFLSQETGEE